MSGANKYPYVGAGSEIYSTSITRFAAVWKSFIDINTRYIKAKQRYEAYAIEEVVEKLFG